MSELQEPYPTNPPDGDQAGAQPALDRPDQVFFRSWLQSLLNQVDIVERHLGISPRTAEIRRMWRRERGK